MKLSTNIKSFIWFKRMVLLLIALGGANCYAQDSVDVNHVAIDSVIIDSLNIDSVVVDTMVVDTVVNVNKGKTGLKKVVPEKIEGKNLIPNNGFEHYRLRRPNPVIRSAKPWVNVGTVDWYNKIDSKDTSFFKGPHSGQCYAGMRFQKNYQEYAYVKLTEPLVEGRTYFFSMYVRLLDISTTSIKQLGVSFSPTPFKKGKSFKNGIVDTTYQNGFGGNFGWAPISSKFVAKGDEKYLILGNFDAEGAMERKGLKDLFKVKEAYYYVDDIELIDTAGFVKEELKKMLVESDTIFQDTTTIHQVAEVKIVHFKNASRQLTYGSSLIVDQIRAILLNNPTLTVEIQGHTDNQGKEEINVKLSKERAKVVYDYLIANGVTNEMKYTGFGSSKPILPNDTFENRSINRRVEIHMYKQY